MKTVKCYSVALVNFKNFLSGQVCTRKFHNIYITISTIMSVCPVSGVRHKIFFRLNRLGITP